MLIWTDKLKTDVYLNSYNPTDIRVLIYMAFNK